MFKNLTRGRVSVQQTVASWDSESVSVVFWADSVFSSYKGDLGASQMRQEQRSSGFVKRTCRPYQDCVIDFQLKIIVRV